MANKTLCVGIFLTTLISHVVQATECEPNAIGVSVQREPY